MKPVFGEKDMNSWEELDYTCYLLGYPDYVYDLLFKYELTVEEVIQVVEMDDAWEEDIRNEELRKKMYDIIGLYRFLLGDNGFIVDKLFKDGLDIYGVVDKLREKSKYIISRTFDEKQRFYSLGENTNLDLKKTTINEKSLQEIRKLRQKIIKILKLRQMKYLIYIYF